MVKSKKIYQISNVLCRNVITGHNSPIEAVILRKNYIISACRLGEIKIWDLYTGSLIKTIQGHSKQINSLEFQEGFIFSAGNDNLIKKWDLKSGECVQTYQAHTKPVLSISIEGDLLASGSDDSQIIIWNHRTGEVLNKLEKHARSVSAVKLSNNLLYSASWDHFLMVWKIPSGELLGEYEEHFDAINAIDVSRNFIVTGDQTGYMNVWDVKTMEHLHRLKHHRLGVMGVKIYQNYLFSTSKDKSVRITDLSTGICVKKLEGHKDASVGIDKDKNFIISSSADKTIRVWDDFSLHSLSEIHAHESIILGVKSQGKMCVTAGTDNVLKLWDAKQEKLVKTIELVNKSWVWGLAVDKNRILASCDDGIYSLYDINSGEKKLDLIGHQGKVYRTMMRGNKAITSGWDNTSRVWDLTTGKCIHILKGHSYAVYSSVIAEDGTYITGSSDGTIRTWNQDGTEKLRIDFHQDEVFHLETQGDLVVSASGDGICGVFNYHSGETIAAFDDHTDQVWTVIIHKNLVITGSADNTIKIWDINTKECLDTLEGHTDNVKDLAICENRLVSGSMDSTIRFWDISKYLDTKLELDEQITSDFDVLVAQIQMARTYNLVPQELGDPGITRILYGMKPLSEDSLSQHEKLVLTIKESANSWYNLGKLGYAPWLSDIPRGIKNGTIPIENNESLDIVLQEFMKGFRENGDLFWMGLLRRYGNNIETLLSKKWSFSIDYSGQGPNPIEGYDWVRLGSKINNVELGDREETALVFRITLQNVNEWILPLIKAFEIQLKDDRGDVGYINFSNFLPDENGNWSSTGMFKIDAGYKMEPNAMLYFTDVNVIYESLLAPSFQGTNILKQLSIIRRENEDMRAKVDTLQQQLVLLSENIASCDLGEIVPKPSSRKMIIEKTVLPGYQLTNLYTSPKSKDIFKRIETQYKEPAIGTLNVKIGETFNKFLEYIQPKFILFTSGSSIVSALISILIYLQIFIGQDFLGNNAINDPPITWVEIIMYSIIYGILLIILILSISSWVKYQFKKKQR